METPSIYGSTFWQMVEQERGYERGKVLKSWKGVSTYFMGITPSVFEQKVRSGFALFFHLPKKNVGDCLGPYRLCKLLSKLPVSCAHTIFI